ncbi:MAG: hypothetical protein ACK4WH_05360 [Phycisphaerales bacterium]
MATTRPRTASEILSVAGRTTLAAAAALAFFLAPPSQALAQDTGIRDPLKPGGQAKDDEAKVKVSEHNTFTLQLNDEELSNVLKLISIQTQKNIVASKNVTGKVTASLYNVTFDEAMSAILHVNGFTYMTNGNFIYVYTQEEYKQIEASLKKRVAKVIRLNYLNSEDAREFVTPLLSKDGGEIKTNTKTKDFSISDKSPVGKDDYALGATLVVIDFEENIAAIEDLIRQIDTRPAQVLVEATILQTALNEANAFGVDFSIIGDIDFLDFARIGGPLSAVNNLIKGGDGTSSGFSPPDNRGGAVVSNPGNTSGPGTMKVGLTWNDVSVFLRLLDQVTDSTILSNPKILALNRQPARVLVGKRVGYLNTTSTETSTTQSVEFLDTGTQLYFRPFVSSEGEIRMELKPQVSVAEIRTVTDANGAAVTIPDEVTQELVTNVNVKDGQTVVLGGLFTENTSFTRRQVPFLGDLPIIGTAFRGNEDSTQRAEIIFLITPTIVTDTMIAASAERAGADIERLRAGNRQGLLPWSQDRMTSALNVEAERLAQEGKYDQALHKIQRSLSLKPNQPEAFRIRERITGLRERWPNPSLLDQQFGEDTSNRMRAITPASPTPSHLRPKGMVDPVLESTRPTPNAPAGASSGQPNPTGTSYASSADTDSSLDAALAATVDPTGSFNGSAGNTPSAGGMSTSIGTNTPDSTNDTFFTTADQTISVSTVDMSAGSTAGNPATASDSPNAAMPMPEKAAIRSVQLALPNLRGQIDLYGLMNNTTTVPIGNAAANQTGWEALVESKMIKQPPRNDYVGGPNASRVVLGTRPDPNFHTNYGWVYNPQTNDLWAVGFDASDKPLPRDATATNPVTPPTQPPTADATQEPLSSRLKSNELDETGWVALFGFSPTEALKQTQTVGASAADDQSK